MTATCKASERVNMDEWPQRQDFAKQELLG